MTLKQRICGFIGHRSDVFEAWNGDRINNVRFICKRCGYKSRWFRTKDCDIEQESKKCCSVGGQFGVDADKLIFCDTCSKRDLCIKERN